MAQDRKDVLREMLSSLDADQIKDLEREFALAAIKAKKDEVPQHERGGPKDPAVQLAAAWAFKFWRRPEFRRHALRTLGDDVLSYEAIGEHMVKTSRERVRQLYAQLCPFDYESEKQERRSLAVRDVG